MTSPTSSSSPHVRARPDAPWPLVPLAPLVVILVGLVVAFAIGLLGVDHLRRATQRHAELRAQLLADTVAARAAALPPEARGEVLRLASRRTAAELVLVGRDSEILADASLGGLDRAHVERFVATRRGVTDTRLGRSYYTVSDVPGRAASLVVLVRRPLAAEGVPALVSSLVALTTLLVVAAAAVAFAVSRDAARDVDFLSQRVDGMAKVRSEPTGERVPVRSVDEIGGLTVAFNALVARFTTAEREYRAHLARARAADRDRAAFLAAVSHELRSPLNAILGFSDILVQEVDGPLAAEAKEEVEQIRGSGQHLLGLINDILELSAIESGQLRLSLGPVDVAHLCRDVAREARLTLGSRLLELRVDGEAPVFAHADARRTRQIIGNLVGNAVKFTAEGEVVIHVAASGGQAEIRVRDTGPGIGPSDRALIFEEYKQARDERGRKRGTGLGLAIARRLAILHGGSITLESQLGDGATFTVTLPLATRPSSPPQSAKEPA